MDGTRPVSTFQAATNSPHSNTIIDEFGSDPLAFVNRRSDGQDGDFVDHELDSIDKGEVVGESSGPTIICAGKGGQSVGADESPQYEFVQGCSGVTVGV